MGVAGVGKTTVGQALARALSVDFVEGDDYHPTANVQKMAAGTPLTDDDRAGWLVALAARIGDSHREGKGLVVTCSALKRTYRDVLRQPAPDMRFVFLRGPRALIAARLASRRGHFMPTSLLESQFATLEEPGPNEDAWTYDVRQSAGDIVTDIVARVGLVES
jgi:gluconokinase